MLDYTEGKINMKKTGLLTVSIVTFSLFIFSTIVSVAFSTEPSAVKTSASYKVVGKMGTSLGNEKHSASFKMAGSLKHLSSRTLTSKSFKISFGRSIFGTGPSSTVQITSISPASGYNTGTVNISSITGLGFLSGATVKLSKTGESDINATSVSVTDSKTIACVFDLTGKTTGDWNLTITNSTGTGATSNNAFTIKTWAEAGSLVNHPNPFNPERETTSIIYKLVGNKDVSLLVFNISAELVYKQDLPSGSNGGKDGDNSVTWNGSNSFGEVCANGVYFARLVDKATGKIIAKGKIAIQR